MKCAEIQNVLLEYGDLSPQDPVRKQVDQHVAHCESCAEELELWQESAMLIQSASDLSIPEPSNVSMSGSVMNRIYQDETWRVPIHHRMYHISFTLRRKLTLVMSFFLTLMMISMYITLANQTSDETHTLKAVMPIATAGSTDSYSSMNTGTTVLEGMPVASISDPILFTVDNVKSDPNYWLALSMLGIVSTLLIMNWLSRIRA